MPVVAPPPTTPFAPYDAAPAAVVAAEGPPGEARFRRLTAAAAIAAAPLALACVALGAAAARFDVTLVEDPATAIATGASGATLVYWSMIANMLGYHLLLLPAALFLDRWLRPRDPDFVRLYSVCGIASLLIGAAGAAALAAAWPPLVRAYAGSAWAPERMALETAFRTVTYVVDGGLWNTLVVTLAAVWWTGMGRLLRRERRAFGTVTLVLGAAAAVDAVGGVLGVRWLAALGLDAYLVLAPLWAAWLGVLAWHGMGAAKG